MIIDGKQIAQEIKNELKLEIEKLISSGQRAPGLGVILVGDDPASQFYVSKKQQDCRELGINSFKSVMEASCTKDQLISIINSYNADAFIDGILLQLPLPTPLRPFTQEILDCISPNKDVDGLTTINLGRLITNSATAVLPCTPKDVWN
jgi:methylenetetrahydrofolate dehydrogenase (NADP+)/methenyltetrahydrofolate cyclohydrolase